MNLPNKLTLLRVCMIPFFVVFMLVNVFGNPIDRYIAVAIFIIASLTDMLDGKIARKYNLITNFGKFMDPLADKLLVNYKALWYFMANGEGVSIPAWIVIIIISRELVISGLRTLAADQGIVIAAGWWGKCKTVSQMVMIIVLIISLDFEWYTILSRILIFIAFALTLISLIDYLIKNKKVFIEGEK